MTEVRDRAGLSRELWSKASLRVRRRSMDAELRRALRAGAGDDVAHVLSDLLTDGLTVGFAPAIPVVGSHQSPFRDIGTILRVMIDVDGGSVVDVDALAEQSMRAQ